MSQTNLTGARKAVEQVLHREPAGACWGTAVALLLLLITSPARAEFPAAVSAWAGAGLGSGHREEVSEAGLFGFGGIEAAWRFAPGRALVASYEGAGGPIGSSKTLANGASSHLDNLEHFAITVGPEFSFPRGSGVALFCRGSAGVGRVATDGSRGMGTLGSTSLTETGFAVSGAGGLRLVPRPGPLGFTIALHSARTFAHHSSCGGVGVTVGIALYPLDRRSDPRLIAEAKGALGALVSAEQVYFQNPISGNAYMDIADTSEARVKLWIDLTEPSERWAFSVSEASRTGFVARASGRDGTVAAGVVVALHHVRGQQPVWTVDDRPRGRGRHR